MMRDKSCAWMGGGGRRAPGSWFALCKDVYSVLPFLWRFPSWGVQASDPTRAVEIGAGLAGVPRGQRAWSVANESLRVAVPIIDRQDERFAS